MGCMVVFDERKCVVVTKLTPCRILATGIRKPNHTHHNLSVLKVNSLSRPSQITSYSLSDNLKREESTSVLDHYPMLQANKTQKKSNEA